MSSEDAGDTSSLDDSGARKSDAQVSPLWARRLALVALILGVIGICVSTARALLRPKVQDPAVVAKIPTGIASAAPPGAPPVTTAVADPPITTAAAASIAAIAEKETPPRPTSQRFDARAARAALDALAPTLADCNIPKGRSGKVEIVFEPDGHVSSAKPLDLYVGTFGGKCVARHLKQGRVPAFYGPTTTYTHVFVIPE